MCTNYGEDGHWSKECPLNGQISKTERLKIRNAKGDKAPAKVAVVVTTTGMSQPYSFEHDDDIVYIEGDHSVCIQDDDDGYVYNVEDDEYAVPAITRTRSKAARTDPYSTSIDDAEQRRAIVDKGRAKRVHFSDKDSGPATTPMDSDNRSGELVPPTENVPEPVVSQSIPNSRPVA